MKPPFIKEKLRKYISQKSPNWKSQADFFDKNNDWLNKSALIALKILSTLRRYRITQKSLAENIGVSPQYISKVVKGFENLSLETICKIERNLGITLVVVPNYETSHVINVSYSFVSLTLKRSDSRLIGYEKSEYKPESKYNSHEEPIAA